MEVFERDGLWWRVCPNCECEISHTKKGNATAAVKAGRSCNECGTKSRRTYAGADNPFYGKRHKPESIEAMKEKNLAQIHKWRTEEFREKQRQLHVQRQIDGYEYKSLERHWTDRYGPEIAAKKVAEWKQKQSKANSGEKNSMYGKPSPNGSGNGWKGYLNGKFFRSLRELKFMVDNPAVQSAEGKRFRASYRWNGVNRTTIPDFVDDENKIVYECKPNRLIGTPLVTAKANAIEHHVNAMGYRFVLLDPGVLTLEIFRALIDNGDVVLTERTNERYLKWLEQ